MVDRPDGRYAFEERWTGVLAASLGSEWRVIEEGLPGRTIVRDDPVEGAFLNGKSYLLPCLLSHKPLDVVAIMLGTNEFKARFHASAWEIAEGLGSLVSVIKASATGPTGSIPHILLISPPPVLQVLPTYAEMFAGAYPKSREYSMRCSAVAGKAGVQLFDAGALIATSQIDGIHLDPSAHAVLGAALAPIIRAMGV